MEQYVTYRVADLRLATYVHEVDRVVRVVTIQPLAQSRPHCLGVINVEGVMLPVVDLRSLLGLPKKEVELSDFLVITQQGEGRFAFLVDQIDNTVFANRQAKEETALVPLPQTLDHMINVNGKVLAVYNLQKLFAEVEAHESAAR